MTPLQQLEEKAKLAFGRVETKPDQYTLSNLDDLAKATQIQGKQQDISERKKFAKWIFFMVVGWLISIVAIIVFVGLKLLLLSDSIILGLIGSTTINVTAFFLAVTKYLFPSKPED
ncbi:MULTISPECIES: hypothetical protein [Arcicella]|uniref:Uncharacterized protein n=1 Tax=Arcicella lustrica TaxID=2984196 RepID=A0ABU5SEX5_9BACT|nr:hypothetical protein [Arcicella sp. DC25W]MEA5425833.1 hypothetical protein [Arcicella sp. DC25W]